jgi:hypothetical protein
MSSGQAAEEFIFDNSRLPTRRSLFINRVGLIAVSAILVIVVALLKPFPEAPEIGYLFALYFLPFGWLLMLISGKLTKGKNRVWKMEAHPDHFSFHRIWSPPLILPYAGIADVLVRYDNHGNFNYDRLEMRITTAKGESLSTGRCRCAGDVVESAAGELRRRTATVTGVEPGNANRDRTTRRVQMAALIRETSHVCMVLAIMMLLVFAWSLQFVHEDLRMRWLGKEAKVVVTGFVKKDIWSTEPPLLSYKRAGSPVDGPIEAARYHDSRSGSLPKTGETIRLHYDPEQPDIVYTAAALPLLAGAWYGVLALWLAAMAACAYFAYFLRTGRNLVLVRGRIIILKPGELMEDRVRGE